MKYSVTLAAVLSQLLVVSALNALPGRYIVEFESAAHSLSPRSVHERRQDIYNGFRSAGAEFEVVREFHDDALFVGASVKVDSIADVQRIKQTAGVVSVRPVLIIPRPVPVSLHVVEGPNDDALPEEPQSTHVMTGVDKLHALGYAGAGIKIGIIDSGVDYTHPALGGAFGPGHKIAGGYDFVGDDYTGLNTAIPDPDPLDQCGGHGTHVAGIVGASPNNPFNITGVAYKADIFAYRLFGCEGSVTDDIIIDALLRGVEDGCDVLTLSLGGADGWTESSSAVVASRIAKSGKIVTISAGNSGSEGSWYTSSPGNGIDVISVASVDNTAIATQNATVSGVEHDPITYYSVFPLAIEGPKPIYVINTDTTVIDDACAPFGDDVPDLSPYVVLVRRGTCNFLVKLENIAAKGGKAALVYNNGGGFNSIASPPIAAAIISAEDGAFLVAQFVAKVDVQITFPQTGASNNFPNPVGGLISAFSSYGPTNDMFMKPSIAGPGGGILSTYLTNAGSYAVLSGTSMSCPLLAGVAALLFEAKGKNAAVGQTARALLQSTSKYVPSSKAEDALLQSVSVQGSGQVNAYDAVFAKTILSTGQFLLNDTANYKSLHTFTVKNIGTKAQRYKLRHVPAGTALSIQAGSTKPSLGAVPLSSDFAEVKFSQSSFLVQPGKTSSGITAHIYAPKKADASRFPVFSGFIEVQSDSGELTHITYMGAVGSLRTIPVLETTDEFFGYNVPVVLSAPETPQVGSKNYTLVDQDVPTIVYRLAFGSPSVRVDLLSTSGDLLGPLVQRDWQSRSAVLVPTDFYELAFTGLFVNGTTVANGAYKIRVSALRVTGSWSNAKDVESWESGVVGIQRST